MCLPRLDLNRNLNRGNFERFFVNGAKTTAVFNKVVWFSRGSSPAEVARGMASRFFYGVSMLLTDAHGALAEAEKPSLRERLASR